jgi:hypothetical protein
VIKFTNRTSRAWSIVSWFISRLSVGGRCFSNKMNSCLLTVAFKVWSIMWPWKCSCAFIPILATAIAIAGHTCRKAFLPRCWAVLARGGLSARPLLHSHPSLADLFLLIRRFDRDWRKIEEYVGTKTVIQVRSWMHPGRAACYPAVAWSW